MLKTEVQQPNQKKSKKKIIWLTCSLSVIIVLVATFWCNKSFLHLYYFNLKNNHFKVNDKLYAIDPLLSPSFHVILFRKVKPINSNLKGRPFMASCGWIISADSLRKYKTAFIGTYTGYEIQSTENINNEYVPMLFFSITTNKKALIKEDFRSNPPVGYEFEDGPLYTWAINITDKESSIFRK